MTDIVHTRVTADRHTTAAGTVVHNVRVNGEVIATRRSAHSYNWCFVKRAGRGDDGAMRWNVTRWSRNSAKRGDEGQIRVMDQ